RTAEPIGRIRRATRPAPGRRDVSTVQNATLGSDPAYRRAAAGRCSVRAARASEAEVGCSSEALDGAGPAEAPDVAEAADAPERDVLRPGTTVGPAAVCAEASSREPS